MAYHIEMMCLLAPSHIRRLFLQTRGDISRCFVVSKPAVFHREVRASRPVTSPERNHSVVMGKIENSTQTNVKMQLFFLQTLTFILLMVHPWLQTSLISVMPCYFAAVCFPSEWECFVFFYLGRRRRNEKKRKRKQQTDRQMGKNHQTSKKAA